MSVIHDNPEPGVIDTDLLKNLVMQQAPVGEAGKVFLRDGIVLEKVHTIRLEDLNILRIDNLWMMTSLVKLQLTLNIIQKIENLDALVNLKELDLSFNQIEVLENLEKLTKLEILTVYENNIKKVENMDQLINLKLFSIGRNRIDGRDSVVYLRRFPLLRSLTMEGNPCSQEDDFTEYIYACLPMLMYYHYRFIYPHEKEAAKKKYSNVLKELEDTEAETAAYIKLREEEERKLKSYTAAFVEYLDSDQLFSALFENDGDGQALLKMDDEVVEVCNEFHDEFCAITQKLFDLGLKQYKIREAEIEQFSRCVEDAKDKNAKQLERIRDTFTEKKALLYINMKAAIRAIENCECDAKVYYAQAQKCTEEFNSICHSAFTDFMASELTLNNQLEVSLQGILTTLLLGILILFSASNFYRFSMSSYSFSTQSAKELPSYRQNIVNNTEKKIIKENIEYEEYAPKLKVNKTFENNLSQLVEVFIRDAQALFSECCNIQKIFSERLAEYANCYLTNAIVRADDPTFSLPPELKSIMIDKETLNKASKNSHAYHIRIINEREDTLVERAKQWARNMCREIHREEIRRNRSKINEFNHFFEIQRQEFEELAYQAFKHEESTESHESHCQD
ncbi:dynein regulatory complex subunit 3-like [Schistocerca serialis cubense]|uniref:dynein regulatory complex subunit 3-like n=1 Tax=Schistocerca serialis cubense TaxID=2023355 RepID=UPI00214E61BA|nr:dynein regulatory complex subunit 3-like [Schistocerca serialis cubense]